MSAQITAYLPSVEFNVDHLKKKTAILKVAQIVCGFTCFVTILVSCRNYYDPWLEETVAGFGGGKAETTFFLFVFTCLFCTSIILLSDFTFVSTNSTLVVKSNFDFIYHSMASVLYLLSSLILIIEVSTRNERSVDKENGFAGKIVAGVFGLINFILYLFSAFFSYKKCV